MSFGGFGGEGYEFESRPEVDAWLRERATDAPTAPTRFEILDGQRIPLPPVSQAHAACTTRLTHILTDALGDLATVSVQTPVTLDESSQPCPDVAVLARRPHDYRDRFATVDDILLLIEVADSNYALTHDRGRKASLYSRCGITECWIVDLVSQQILIHQSPASGGYRDIRNMRPEATLMPVRLPGISLAAEALLADSRPD